MVASFDFEEMKNKIKNKNNMRSFKNSKRINEKWDGPYHGFGYLSLFSDTIDLATWSQRELLSTGVDKRPLQSKRGQYI